MINISVFICKIFVYAIFIPRFIDIALASSATFLPMSDSIALVSYLKYHRGEFDNTSSFTMQKSHCKRLKSRYDYILSMSLVALEKIGMSKIIVISPCPEDDRYGSGHGSSYGSSQGHQTQHKVEVVFVRGKAHGTSDFLSKAQNKDKVNGSGNWYGYAYAVHLHIGSLRSIALDLKRTWKRSAPMTIFLCTDFLASYSPNPNSAGGSNIIEFLKRFDKVVFISTYMRNSIDALTTPVYQAMYKASLGSASNAAPTPTLSSDGDVLKAPPVVDVIPSPIHPCFISPAKNEAASMESLSVLRISIFLDDDTLARHGLYDTTTSLFNKFRGAYKPCTANHNSVAGSPRKRCVSSLIYLTHSTRRLAAFLDIDNNRNSSSSSQSWSYSNRRLIGDAIDSSGSMTIVNGVNKTELAAALQASAVLWILVGDDSDPVSPSVAESRELLLAEAMTVGCVPVLVHVSTSASPSSHSHMPMLHPLVSKLVVNGTNGYSGASLHSVVALTVSHLQLPWSVQGKMRSAAVEAVQGMSVKAVSAAWFTTLLHSTEEAAFRAFVRENTREMRRRTMVLPARLPVAAVKSSSSTSSSAMRRVALIIEPRVVMEFEYCVRNVLHFLGHGWTLQVHHSIGDHGNELFVRGVLQGIDNVTFVPLPFPVHDQSTYNNVVKSESFWKALSRVADKVLIFQTDSVMLRTGIDTFLKYDYIGAPWSLNDKDPNTLWLRKMRRYKVFLEAVGNGGFSLRSVRAMLSVIEATKRKRDSSYEDTYFAFHLEKDAREKKGNWVLPPRGDAYKFALEVTCPDMSLFFNTSAYIDVVQRGDSAALSAGLSDRYVLPMALHSAWKYLSYVEAYRLLALSLPR